MKVYEVIAKLYLLPAGAEIYLSANDTPVTGSITNIELDFDDRIVVWFNDESGEAEFLEDDVTESCDTLVYLGD